MLSDLDNRTLESFLAAIDVLSNGSTEGAADNQKFLNVLQNKGIPETVAQETLNSLEAGRFTLLTLKSATAFALFQRLTSYQNVCIAGAALSVIITIGSLLLTTSGFYLSCGGAFVFCVVGAIKFSREKKAFVGTKDDFDTVEKRIPSSFLFSSSDQY